MRTLVDFGKTIQNTHLFIRFFCLIKCYTYGFCFSPPNYFKLRLRHSQQSVTLVTAIVQPCKDKIKNNLKK